jgi:hypothetical protein
VWEFFAKQPAAVDEGAPGSADAAEDGEAGRREAPEDIRQRVFR